MDHTYRQLACKDCQAFLKAHRAEHPRPPGEKSFKSCAQEVCPLCPDTSEKRKKHEEDKAARAVERAKEYQNVYIKKKGRWAPPVPYPGPRPFPGFTEEELQAYFEKEGIDADDVDERKMMMTINDKMTKRVWRTRYFPATHHGRTYGECLIHFPEPEYMTELDHAKAKKWRVWAQTTRWGWSESDILAYTTPSDPPDWFWPLWTEFRNGGDPPHKVAMQREIDEYNSKKAAQASQ
jgi:hypothetical protein